nr:unnamed protein product [Callosobruchus analis]
MASKQEQEERELAFKNRVMYSYPVKMGFWNDELALRENKIALMEYKKQNCELYRQKTKRMYRNALKPTSLVVEAPYVLYGVLYQLRAPDVVSDNAKSLYLSAVIDEKDIVITQHFRHGCILSASPESSPVVRNTFRFRGPNFDKVGKQVVYGEDVYIQISESSGEPLFIQCENATTDTCGAHLPVRLTQSPDTYCRFKFYHWNPLKRQKTIGTTFKPATRVILQHTASGRNLAVIPKMRFPTFYGTECMVTCHNFLDSHKLETAENFWNVISGDTRKEKGSDVTCTN